MPTIITVDFESFYDKDYSLSKLTTESYVNDKRFEVIGVGVKVGDGPTETCTASRKQTAEWLDRFNWEDAYVLCHNTLFDGTILAYRFGIKPKMWLDTLSMGRAIHGTEVGGSLKALAEYYEVGEKGTEVMNALGKRRLQFTGPEMDAYMAYCANDVDLTYEIFKRMAPAFNKAEIKLIDMTIRMHTEPKLLLDQQVLKDHLYVVRTRKEELMAKIATDKKELMSNPKFAEALLALGVAPPMKTSLRTGKETYAFAKSDEEMKALLEHDNPDVQALVAARIGVKSTLEETRTQRFIDMADRFGKLPVPLKYYGAMTGRWAASDKTNLQNLPRGSTIKEAITAPEGWKIVGADLSNIELRVGLYFAGQLDKLNLLAQGTDLYKDFASAVYNLPMDEINDEQRFMGKTCIAEGTLVLCDSGWKPIETVSVNDRVWDGEDWVCHQGLVSKGWKETLSVCGSWLTPDHLVWSGTQWLESQSVVSDSSILSQALGIAAENLPLQATYKAPEVGSRRSSCNAIAESLNTLWTNTTSRLSRVLDAINAQEKQEPLNGSGLILKPCLMTNTDVGCSTALPLRLIDATTQKTPTIKTTAHEVYQCMKHGDWIKPPSCGMSRQYRDGMFQSLKWTASTLMETMSRVTFGSYQGLRTPKINDKSTNLRLRLPVYDLLSCGPRNRFTILTKQGPLIVHNCQLSLIYGTGPGKLRNAIKMMSGKDIGELEAKRIVDIYRRDYSLVKESWYEGDKMLHAMRDNTAAVFGKVLPLPVLGSAGIKLPSELFLKYPDLKQHENELGRKEWSYAQRKERVRIHGPKTFQNCIGEGTPVLTHRGWVPIEEVTLNDYVHDGEMWVSHGGVIFQSVQSCITIDGVWMTPDHEVLTNEGWKAASQNPRPYRPDIRNVTSIMSRSQRWKKEALEISMRLRKSFNQGWNEGAAGSSEGRYSELRMRYETANSKGKHETRNVFSPSLCSMGQYARTLLQSAAPSLQELRREGHNGVRAMARVLRKLLGRHGDNLSTWVRARQERQQWTLLRRELSLGLAAAECNESQGYTPYRYTDAIKTVRDRKDYPVQPPEVGVAHGEIVGYPRPSQQERKVYDILDCGPRTRFVVKGKTGPLIVHNCIQALARCVMGESMVRIAKRLPVALTIHDAVYCMVPDQLVEKAAKFIVDELKRAPEWASELPLDAEVGAGQSLAFKMSKLEKFTV